MPNYDLYNREERAICAHLFRLLHENIEDKQNSPLSQFVNLLSKQELGYRNGVPNLEIPKFENVAIYCETSIIRDAYYHKKPNVNGFMDDLTRVIIKQENLCNCRLYSELPDQLNNIKLTHPKQIRQKAIAKNIELSEEECKVFGAMQGMFNAKPDLVITIDNLLIVCEAKLTEPFDNEQLKRTWNIAEVWATLLYNDFGFTEPPIYTVFKLGATKYNPHINWDDISEIANKTYKPTDRTRIAISAGKELLQ